MQRSLFFTLCMSAGLFTCGASASSQEQTEITITAQSTPDTPAPTRSFLYGFTSGLSLDAIQYMLMAGIAYRLRGTYPFDKLTQETSGSMDTGATALACAGGFASTASMDTLFHVYGKDFCSGLDNEVDARLIQKGYDYGRGFVSLGVVLSILLSPVGEESNLANYVMCNEAASFITTLIRSHLLKDAYGNISFDYIDKFLK